MLNMKMNMKTSQPQTPIGATNPERRYRPVCLFFCFLESIVTYIFCMSTICNNKSIVLKYMWIINYLNSNTQISQYKMFDKISTYSLIIGNLCLISILSSVAVLISYYMDRQKLTRKIFPIFILNMCLSDMFGNIATALVIISVCIDVLLVSPFLYLFTRLCVCYTHLWYLLGAAWRWQCSLLATIIRHQSVLLLHFVGHNHC